MSVNWLDRMESDPVFAGSKLIVVGGSSGMGKQTGRRSASRRT